MLSKAIRPINNSVIQFYKRAYGSKPGVLHRIFNTLDKSTTAYSVARSDPTEVLKGLSSIQAQDVPHEYNVTNLTNGFTVLTES